MHLLTADTESALDYHIYEEDQTSYSIRLRMGAYDTIKLKNHRDKYENIFTSIQNNLLRERYCAILEVLIARSQT